MYGIALETFIGSVSVICTENAVCEIRFEKTENLITNDIAEKAEKQLRQYLSGTRVSFDLPLSPIGTEFQKSVWTALMAIPYGKTRSYGEIAAAIGKPGAARAVGQANHRNPIPIIIPCHRVINADGTEGGYGGGISIKEKLLELERAMTF